MLELLVGLVVVVALVIGFFLGQWSKSDYIATLERFVKNLGDVALADKAQIRELTNTILLMRREGNTAPPLDDDWGVYSMPETLESDTDSLT